MMRFCNRGHIFLKHGNVSSRHFSQAASGSKEAAAQKPRCQNTFYNVDHVSQYNWEVTVRGFGEALAGTLVS